MKTKRWVLMSVLMPIMVCLPGLALADGTETFRFTGHSQARQVCKAVAEDDVKMLKRTLRDYRSSLVHRYTHDSGGRDVARDFTCNNMSLRAFAESIGAQAVAGYIGDGSSVDKAQVAATGR